VSTKAERFPRRRIRRLTDEQRRALDELQFSHPGPARRGELKTVLGWKRTREETIAFALDLIDKGMIVSAVAGRLDVETRYLRNLLKRDATPENGHRKPSVHAGESATNVQTPTGESSRGLGPVFFRSFADLDRWLEEHAA
jgi:hypothetical protein